MWLLNILTHVNGMHNFAKHLQQRAQKNERQLQKDYLSKKQAVTRGCDAYLNSHHTYLYMGNSVWANCQGQHRDAVLMVRVDTMATMSSPHDGADRRGLALEVRSGNTHYAGSYRRHWSRVSTSIHTFTQNLSATKKKRRKAAPDLDGEREGLGRDR